MALEFERERDAANATIRRPLLRGWQSVAGLWFPADWLDEAERARRILRNWQSGTQAFRFADGDLLRYARPLELDCDALDGWALRSQGRTLCSAPLTAEEAAALPCADLWLVLGGEVLSLTLATATPLNPAGWLDISAYRRVAAYDCRPILPAMERAVIAPDSVRDALDGKVPAAASERDAFLRDMAGGQAATDSIRKASGAEKESSNGHGPNPTVPRHRKAGVVDKLASALEKWLGKQTEGSGSSSGGGVGGSSSRGGPQPGAIPERGSPPPVQRWREWLTRVAVMSQFSRVFGQRQAAYMRRMLEMFEDGRLDEALRHAIPLGSDGEASLGPSFGVPQARRELGLTAGKEAGMSIQVDERLSEYLRQLYRKAFERLDRAGRFEEAVFVLAERLNAREEALDYLERHDRLKQAAALALAWDSKPGTIVRLYCLAGDWQSAVAVARRDRAFAEAIALLERKWPEAAARLREEWADYLVARGDWLEAVEAIWPVRARQERAREWLLAAEAAGGSLGARALVKRAVLLPDALDACSEQIEGLRRDPERYRERAAIAQAVLDLPEKRGKAATVLRPLLRALLMDQARGLGQIDYRQWRKQVSVSGDKLLQQDLPGTDFVVQRSACLYRYDEERFEALSSASALPIADAVPLPDGRYLLACGEAGVAVVPVSTEAGGVEVLFFDYYDNQTCARVAWPGTMPVGLRCVGDQWLLFDRQGRLFHLDTETSKGYDIHLH